MKAIVVVFAIFVVTILGALTAFTDEQKAELIEYKEFCIGESGIDPAVIQNAKNGKVSEDDEKLACFATCLLKKIGVMNADGDTDWDVARSKMPPGVPQDKADDIYNACKDITGTGCSKGGNLFKCFLENNAFSYFVISEYN